jgi:hypothetical protein
MDIWTKEIKTKINETPLSRGIKFCSMQGRKEITLKMLYQVH